jgi:poly-gamma-glutamate synthesis protein (capsule biosynthesis protein)
LALIRTIRNSDVAIVNLETILHEFKGYPQADSGGTHLATSPFVAEDLAWAGITMVGHANNHAFDYGSMGILENLKNVEKAGIILAGSGADLVSARSPRIYRHPKATVALIAAASTFASYGRASRSGTVRGRPGINPLSVERGLIINLSPRAAEYCQRLSVALGFKGWRFGWNRFRVGPFQFAKGPKLRIEQRPRFNPNDLRGVLASIRDAATQANVTVMSLHDHLQGPLLRRFARMAIDAGASVILVHGPHEIRGLELYRGKPIFYCLGNFVYEPEYVERLPAEYYETHGLDESKGERAFSWLNENQDTWEGLAANLQFRESHLSEISLLPIDLGVGQRIPVRGRPRLADEEVGRRLIGKIAAKSRRYGTRIRYDASQNVGRVELE